MPFPVIGTIEPAVRVARTHSHGGTIAVIGTDATIASGVYDRALKSSMPGAQVLSFACPLFVPLVEQGMFEGEIVEKVIELYLGRITAASVESLVLGCTHYPLLRPAMESFLGGRIRIIECSTAVAEACRLTCVSLADSPDWARSAEEPRTSEKSKQMTTDGSTQDRTNATYFVTDTPSRFNFFARNFLGDELLSARVVELSSP
jgi:glutamate racemase